MNIVVIEKDGTMTTREVTEADMISYPPMPPEARKMTKLAFRNRFTAAEKAALELGATHDPSASTEAQLKAASMRAFLADVIAANHIEPDRAETRGGVEVLEQWGFLADGRAAEILDAPIQDFEKPE